MSIDSFEASRKRSDEIRADLPIHPEKYTMLTGDRPTGRLHMGHYFGTIRERVACSWPAIWTTSRTCCTRATAVPTRSRTLRSMR